MSNAIFKCDLYTCQCAFTGLVHALTQRLLSRVLLQRLGGPNPQGLVAGAQKQVGGDPLLLVKATRGCHYIQPVPFPRDMGERCQRGLRLPQRVVPEPHQ